MPPEDDGFAVYRPQPGEDQDGRPIGGIGGGEPTPGPSFQNRSQVFNNRGRLGNQYTRTRAPRIR